MLLLLLYLLLLVFIVTVFKSICSEAYFNHVLVDNASAVLTCIRYKRIKLTYLSEGLIVEAHLIIIELYEFLSTT